MATIKLNRALVLDRFGFRQIGETFEVEDSIVAELVAQHGTDITVVTDEPKDSPILPTKLKK